MASGTGPPTDGIVRNSALSFVAPAQPSAENGSGSLDMSLLDRLVPAGLKALYDICHQLYPDQPNPLQVTTKLKYWLGGQDPLDYISMYWNEGNPNENIPPHWHYISFGLSDLHGDGRVHPPPDRVLLSSGIDPEPVSGCGFELTFRLAARVGETVPLWPAALLRALARYVFATGNKFCAGDHVSWHAALDGAGAGAGAMRHLLVCADPALPAARTHHGTVAFLQVVGCTGRELRAAQRGSGFDVLKLMSEDPNCGGPWLVTRMDRRRSCGGVLARHEPARPAHLAGVSAALRWTPYTHKNSEPAACEQLSATVEQQIKDTLQRGLTSMGPGTQGHLSKMSTDSFEMSSIERALPEVPDLMQGSWRSEDSVEYLDGVHLIMNAEGASLLPLAIDCRVLHSRHFTWRDARRAVTFVSRDVADALPTPERPYARRGSWLQILIPKPLAEQMSKEVSHLSRLSETDSETDSDDERGETKQPISLPLTLTWPEYKFKITVVSDLEVL